MSGTFGKAARRPEAIFRRGLIPGLTTAAVVLPKALAYATIAQLPVQAGLFSALVPMAIYAVLGTSRVLSVSTTTPIAILCASAIGEALAADPALDPLVASATLSVLVGAMLLAARALRFGFVANFISEPVLTGFKAGVGLVIIVDQLPKLLGIHIHKAGFFRDVASIACASQLNLLAHARCRAGDAGDHRALQALPAESPRAAARRGHGDRHFGPHRP